MPISYGYMELSLYPVVRVNSPSVNFNLRNYVAMHLKAIDSNYSAKPNYPNHYTLKSPLGGLRAKTNKNGRLKVIWYCNLYSQ